MKLDFLDLYKKRERKRTLIERMIFARAGVLDLNSGHK